jgi:tRNA dimethylallyltransferase
VTAPTLYVLVGATASGKERLALEIARRIGGEIVSMDSMKVYRGLDIATAKASPEDRAAIRHHCLDLVEPTEGFSAADFVRHAEAAIAAIAGRGGRPVLSGGTAFYCKALLEGLFEGPAADPVLRESLERRADAEGTEALHRELAGLDAAAAAKIHPSDRRRLIRALEVIALTGDKISSRQTQWAGFHARQQAFAPSSEARYPYVMIRLTRSRAETRRRIGERIKRMVDAGLLDEAKTVFDRRGELSRIPLQAVGYKEFFPYFQGEAGLDAALERLAINTGQLAKSQDTWFRKFPATELAAMENDTPERLADRVVDGILGL